MSYEIALMGPRWKGKGSEAKALADPMSKIISQLQSTLIQSDSHGLLSGCSVLLEVETEQTELLNRACFGRPIITAQKDKQWFQLDMEEAFYLCYHLKCLKIVGEDGCTNHNDEVWEYMKSKRETFPVMFKAYSYFRTRNWVVRSGSQYGVDFVAYRHHPALVHSEYAVLVSLEADGNANGRLRVWSDFQCTIRLCGGVAKTLLVLYINKNGASAVSPSCLESYSVEECTITRWSAEQSREDKTVLANCAKGFKWSNIPMSAQVINYSAKSYTIQPAVSCPFNCILPASMHKREASSSNNLIIMLRARILISKVSHLLITSQPRK